MIHMRHRCVACDGGMEAIRDGSGKEDPSRPHVIGLFPGSLGGVSRAGNLTEGPRGRRLPTNYASASADREIVPKHYDMNCDGSEEEGGE